MAANLPNVVNPVADFDYGQYGKREFESDREQGIG